MNLKRFRNYSRRRVNLNFSNIGYGRFSMSVEIESANHFRRMILRIINTDLVFDLYIVHVYFNHRFLRSKETFFLFTIFSHSVWIKRYIRSKFSIWMFYVFSLALIYQAWNGRYVYLFIVYVPTWWRILGELCWKNILEKKNSTYSKKITQMIMKRSCC